MCNAFGTRYGTRDVLRQNQNRHQTPDTRHQTPEPITPSHRQLLTTLCPALTTDRRDNEPRKEWIRL